MKSALIALVLSFTILSTTAAQAAMAVVDTTALAQWSERISGLKKQIETAVESMRILTLMNDGINTVSKFMQEQADTLGRIGKIQLPFLNTAKLAVRLQKDIKCLQTDLTNIMPRIDFDDLDFGSICDSRASYQELFWVDQTKVRKNGRLDYKTLQKLRDRATIRRNALAKTTSAAGLAAAHIASTQAATIAATAIDELERNVREAKTIQDRLGAIAQGIILQNRQAAQLNTMTAEILRIQATQLMLESSPAYDESVIAGIPDPTVGQPAAPSTPAQAGTP